MLSLERGEEDDHSPNISSFFSTLTASVTLFMPSNRAVQKWREELPEILKPGRSDLELLVKAWIVDAVVPSSSIRDNDVKRSSNGVGLRFNKYDTPTQREPKVRKSYGRI